MSWLADSSGVVTAARRHDTWDRDFAIDLYVVPLGIDSDGVRCLTGHDGRYSHPSVSPDGHSVAFIGYGDTRTMTQNAKVGILPTDSENAPEAAIRWISAGFDRTFEATSGHRLRSGSPPRNCWRWRRIAETPTSTGCRRTARSCRRPSPTDR